MVDDNGHSVTAADVIKRLAEHHTVEPVRCDGFDRDVDTVCRRLKSSAAVAGIRIQTERSGAIVKVRYLGQVLTSAQVIRSMNTPPGI